MTLRSPSYRLRLAFFALLAFLIPFLLFLPSVRYPLVALDDSAYVAANPVAKSPLSLQNAPRAFAFRSPAPMYVPVLWLSYMFDATLWGNHPWAFHLGNAIFHAFNSLLLFFLLRSLCQRFFSPSPSSPDSHPSTSSSPACRSPFVAGLLSPLFLALLWACHPLRVESVAWVAERKDCLAVFFCLLTVLAWLPAVSPSVSLSRRWAYGLLSFLCFALGLLSKPSLVPLPVLLLFLACPPLSARLAFGRFGSILVALPFLAASALCSVATTRLHALNNNFTAPPLLSRLATIPSVFFFYLRKTLFPGHLSVIYPEWTSPLGWGILLAIPCLAVALAVFLRRHANPLLWLGAFWLALFFLPVSGIVPVPFNLVADRFTCLPAIGLSIALLPVFAAPGRLRRLFLALVLLACIAGSSAALPKWRSDDALYASARRFVPDHPAIRGFDATTARMHGDFLVSRLCIARAQQAKLDRDGNLDYPLLLLDVPNINALDGPQSALDFLQTIPPAPPDHPKWADLATAAQLALGRNEEVLSTALQALPCAVDGDASRTALLLAAMIASHRLGNPADALHYAHLSGVIPPSVTEIDPHHFLSYYLYLWNNDDRVPALDYFRQIVRDYPDPGVLNNISWILASSFWSPAPSSEALDLARRALAATPASSPLRPTFLDTLAVALANDGQFDAAVSTVSEAISLLPSSSPALPDMQRRLDLYRQSLPYREIKEKTVPVSEYSYDPRL